MNDVERRIYESLRPGINGDGELEPLTMVAPYEVRASRLLAREMGYVLDDRVTAHGRLWYAEMSVPHWRRWLRDNWFPVTVAGITSVLALGDLALRVVSVL